MKIPRIFVDQPLQADQQFTLDHDASKYLIRVLRRTKGDRIIAFNGDGSDYTATITTAGKATGIQINHVALNASESPLSITLAQSLAKGTKLDLVIQKATELGVDRIIPISSDRSVLQIEQSRLAKRMDHWRGVAISACGQCQRSTIPVIEQPQSLNQWLENNSHENTFLLHPQSNSSLGSVALNGLQCNIVVGPEGGFSEVEIATSLSHGIKAISCGPRILRTETAGFTAIAIIQSRFGDLK